MTMAMSPFFLAFLVFSLLSMFPTEASLNENERLIEYRKRNYTWPLESVVPNTDGWRALMKRRFDQVAAIRNKDSRYEGYLQLINSAAVAPNFTETGWGLSKISNDLLDSMQQGVRDGLPNARSEGFVDVIGGKEPLFVDRPDLTARVLNEMQPLLEAWSGIPLKGHRAYGFRLYQNNSRLYMHTDKSSTHVVSAIVHVDRSEDAEPWPIVIEDLHGYTNEVLLEPGDILFYESSKCFHGRPKKFIGSWYTSVFVHFYPRDGWIETDHKLENHFAVPPVWNVIPPEGTKETLEMIGTSMREPACSDGWCDLKDAVKWQGPGVEGHVLTTYQHKYTLNLEHDEL